jgi:hypothetical protein
MGPCRTHGLQMQCELLEARRLHSALLQRAQGATERAGHAARPRNHVIVCEAIKIDNDRLLLVRQFRGHIFFYNIFPDISKQVSILFFMPYARNHHEVLAMH